MALCLSFSRSRPGFAVSHRGGCTRDGESCPADGSHASRSDKTPFALPAQRPMGLPSRIREPRTPEKEPPGCRGPRGPDRISNNSPCPHLEGELTREGLKGNHSGEFNMGRS